MVKKVVNNVLGIIRIKTNLKVYENTKSGWKLSQKEFPEAISVIKLFEAHNNLDLLKDKKDVKFFKGQLSSEGKVQGARMNVLPDGKKLNGAYSLFAEHLVIHDQSTDEHWDIMYKNPSGNCYLYTLDKKNIAIKSKFKKVNLFEKYYPLIKRKVGLALKNKNDPLAVPMQTLLKTKMRVGNEIYYKLHGHKGLTTLKKKDISLSGNNVTFNYLAKDGVPRRITERFSNTYIKRLSEILKPLKKDSFVFVNSQGHPLKDTCFKKAFKEYCGKDFYPHIVRSYYATHKTKEFLKEKRKVTKHDVEELFLSIAHKLGHQKFVKKKNIWIDNYNTTIHHYIQPELVEEVKNRIK